MTAARQRIGQRAEAAVGEWLASSGWRVLDRRARTPWGELDLVAIDPAGTLVGVEVKLRRHARSGSGAEAVDARRLARLRSALVGYASRPQLAGLPLRLDLVVVTPSSVPDRWLARRHAGIGAW
jgi:putative endonuclease